MAAPTNTIVPAGVAGNREDLSNLIERVAPEKTPFCSNIKGGGVKVTATRHEWQTETLATPDAASAQVDGDDTTSFEANTRTRVANRVQTKKRAVVVAGIQEAVDSAGVASEMARQKLIKGIELKRDFEARFIGNYASSEESGVNGRKAAGALAWATSNVSRGSGGANGGYSGTDCAAATNGTQRTFTKDIMDAVIQSGFNNGATFSQIYMSAAHKAIFAGFAGLAANRYEINGMDEGVVVGGADVYLSNHGKLTIIPVQYGLTRDALFVDPSMCTLGTLRSPRYEELSKTGDNEKGQILGDMTLIVKNEKGLGVAADLT